MSLSRLLKEIRKCDACHAFLSHGPRPVIAAGKTASILVIGQAPGKKVHETGITWNDKSGDRLREWFDMDKDLFYDESRIAMMPMGFCYPGKDKNGDLPPRKECAPLWHQSVINKLPNVKLIILIGHHAQQYYLKENNLTETVKNFKEFAPYFPLPHPSPRNFMWFRKNAWFEEEVLPSLRTSIRNALN